MKKNNNKAATEDKNRKAVYKAFGIVNYIRGKVLSVAADYAVKDPTGAQNSYIEDVVKVTFTTHGDIIHTMWDVWGYPLNMKADTMAKETERVAELIADKKGLSAVNDAVELLGRELNKVEGKTRVTASWVLARIERIQEACKDFIDEYETDEEW